MNKFLCFLLIAISVNVYSQDTIYLGEFASKIVKKEKATKYKIVTPDPSEKDVFNERLYYMDGSVYSSRRVYKYYKKKRENLSFNTFYRSGNKHIVCIYKNGKTDGEFLSYWENGSLKRKDIFDNGKFIEGTCWDEEGDEVPFYKFEIQAVYPGGSEAMIKYITENFDLSQVPVGSTYSRVVVSFYIDIEGNVVDVKLDQGADPMTNYQAVSLVMKMPKWSLAMQDGHPVKVKKRLPIRLK